MAEKTRDMITVTQNYQKSAMINPWHFMVSVRVTRPTEAMKTNQLLPVEKPEGNSASTGFPVIPANTIPSQKRQ